VFAHPIYFKQCSNWFRVTYCPSSLFVLTSSAGCFRNTSRVPKYKYCVFQNLVLFAFAGRTTPLVSMLTRTFLYVCEKIRDTVLIRRFEVTSFGSPVFSCQRKNHNGRRIEQGDFMFLCRAWQLVSFCAFASRQIHGTLSVNEHARSRTE